MSILDRVNYPEDLKSLTLSELEQLARELREYIINTVSKTGGHLAPNLGTIELTIALLRVFDLPKDKVIWDVGHQAYGYKILTGRKDRFHTLRQLGGISGFLKRDESEYDFWGAGHASTAISAALGFATHRDLAGENYNVVAVVGDGSMTGGLAFEGLNNAGASEREILIILNDNAMSISPNVGALAKHFTKLVASRTYQNIKSYIWNLTTHLGEIGKKLRYVGRKIDEALKTLIVPNMFFEQLGFEYYGPVDGHNIRMLITILEEIKPVKKPKLLHILTKKGKGYIPAEKDATTYHGLGKFNPETGEPIKVKSTPTYTKVFGETMVQFGERYTDLVAITAAMETGTGLDMFHKKFPERFFDVGIAEGHAIIFGGAIAAQGRRTVAAIYSTFLQRAYDPIIHDIALQRVPLIMALDRAGVVGEDGPTHHGVFDIAYLRHIPGIVVTAPKDEQELRDLLLTALERFDSPWTIRYPRGQGLGVKLREPIVLPFGKWEVISEGDGKLLILAVGTMVNPAIKAVEKLGIKATVVNCRFIKPMDEKLLSDLLDSHEIVLTVEEGCAIGGFGEGVAAFAQTRGMPKEKVVIHAIPDKFIQHGKREELLKILGLDADGIANIITKIFEGTEAKLKGKR